VCPENRNFPSHAPSFSFETIAERIPLLLFDAVESPLLAPLFCNCNRSPYAMLRCRQETVVRHVSAFVRLLSALPEHRLLTMPKVSPTMTHGRLVEWKKGEGEEFAEGDMLAEVETDKAIMPIEAKDDGFFARIFVPSDTPDVPLGQVLAITVEEKQHIAAFADYTLQDPSKPPDPARSSVEAKPHTPPTRMTMTTPSTAQPTTTMASAATPAPSAAVDTQAHAPPTEYVGHVSPAVARILNEFPTADLNRVRATGPKGNILKGDLLGAILDGSAFGRETTAPLPSIPLARSPASAESLAGYTDVPVSSMRRAIARRLTESKHGVPHRYATVTYELDALMALRKRLNASDPSPKVSVNDFVIRAVAVALRRVPAMNAQWDPASSTVVPNKTVDVAFAVALPGGLITPIVKNADAQGLASIAAETKRLVGLARAGSLAPDEFEGGSFSVSNLGMYGVSSFSAIINPPQSGILAVASGFERALVDESGQGLLRKANVGTATLSTDARVVGEDSAANFLREFSSCITNPDNMLL
jgi:pyruvate dehydrogenase E2 component (dihydrolipoamide acetyltransferase)